MLLKSFVTFVLAAALAFGGRDGFTPQELRVTRLTLTARFTSSTGFLTGSIAAQGTLEGCRLRLLGYTADPTRQRVSPRVLLTIDPAIPNTTYFATGVTSTRAASVAYLRAQSICGRARRNSNLRKVTLRRTRNGVRSPRRWLRSVAENVQTEQGYSLSQAFPQLTFELPVDLQAPNDGSGRLFVVQQKGQILSFTKAAGSTATEVLDISDRSHQAADERGLLGLAFHPQFASNGFFFVNYTRQSDGATVISRFRMSTVNPAIADPSSEFVLLVIAQPFANHNGGGVAFGPDGNLYIGMGDGGSGGDPQGNGQDLTTLLGDFLRINVDTPSPGLNYGIPSDNPYVGNTQGFREEIWASGFRNPFRFSWDFETNTLWAGDVGQGRREEIDIVERGLNYGWNRMEGTLCYPSGEPCALPGLTLPVIDYNRDVGSSVSGGYVYRGSRLPLVGQYLYADFVQGRIFALRRDGATFSNRELINSELNISGFGKDTDGEVYVISYGDGKIYQLTTP